MLDYRLKAIEIVNIADIAVEREQFISLNESLKTKKAELDKQEESLMREKIRKEMKSKIRSPKGGLDAINILTQQTMNKNRNSKVEAVSSGGTLSNETKKEDA